MTRFLLDTNIVSDLVHDPHGRITEQIREDGEARVCTSIIVAAELRFGAAKRTSARLDAQLEAVLAALDILPFEAPAHLAYGRLRAGLSDSGRRPAGTTCSSRHRHCR